MASGLFAFYCLNESFGENRFVVFPAWVRVVSVVILSYTVVTQYNMVVFLSGLLFISAVDIRHAFADLIFMICMHGKKSSGSGHILTQLY